MFQIQIKIFLTMRQPHTQFAKAHFCSQVKMEGEGTLVEQAATRIGHGMDLMADFAEALGRGAASSEELSSVLARELEQGRIQGAKTKFAEADTQVSQDCTCPLHDQYKLLY